MKQVTADPRQFLGDMHALAAVAAANGNFSLSWSNFRGNLPQAISPQWRADFEVNWLAQFHRLIPVLQVGSERCLSYGADFDEFSFFGQGAAALRFAKSRRRVLNIDTRIDVVTGAEYYWASVDGRRPPSDPGEIYFYRKLGQTDWARMFGLCSSPGHIGNLRSASRSTAGMDRATKHVSANAEDVVIRYDFNNVHIFAHPSASSNLVRLAMLNARFANAAGYEFDTEVPRQSLLGER